MTITVPPDTLLRFCSGILATAGLPPADADLVAASLVDANLRGVDSHGVSRVPIYVDRLSRGLVNPQPDVTVVDGAGGALVVDGDNGMGAVVTSRALDLALNRLPGQGTLAVAIRATNHYGAGAFYARRAVERGAAVFLYANAPATMAAWGGRDRVLGTNPYTFAAPAGDGEPLILDMATSVVARGKIIAAARRGEDIPLGWAVDVDGEPTTDAQAALAGSVLPFGGPKGYGIALMVEVMAGILSGAAFGPGIGDLYDNLERPQNAGAFLHLVDVRAFLPPESFAERMKQLVATIKDTGADGREVLVPGELEAETARRRAMEGIPVPEQLVADLEGLAPVGTLTDAAPAHPDSDHQPAQRPTEGAPHQ